MRSQGKKGCQVSDDYMTPPELANQIVQHFRPTGLTIEPCRGAGAFYMALLHYCPEWQVGPDWFEIKEGRDFLTQDFAEHRYDWMITNPPWSLINPFLDKSLGLADNIVFLCTTNHLFTKCRRRMIDDAGYGIRELVYVPWPDTWNKSGFTLSANYIQKGWTGGITETNWGGFAK